MRWALEQRRQRRASSMMAAEEYPGRYHHEEGWATAPQDYYKDDYYQPQAQYRTAPSSARGRPVRVVETPVYQMFERRALPQPPESPIVEYMTVKAHAEVLSLKDELVDKLRAEHGEVVEAKNALIESLRKEDEACLALKGRFDEELGLKEAEKAELSATVADLEKRLGLALGDAQAKADWADCLVASQAATQKEMGRAHRQEVEALETRCGELELELNRSAASEVVKKVGCGCGAILEAKHLEDLELVSGELSQKHAVELEDLNKEHDATLSLIAATHAQALSDQSASVRGAARDEVNALKLAHADELAKHADALRGLQRTHVYALDNALALSEAKLKQERLKLDEAHRALAKAHGHLLQRTVFNNNNPGANQPSPPQDQAVDPFFTQDQPGAPTLE